MRVYSPEEARQMILDGTAPDYTFVTGNLNFWREPTLTALPDCLHVKGDLYLDECTSLAELPYGLRVDGNLYLGGCHKLTALPSDLKVGKRIFLNLPLRIPRTVQCKSFEFKGVDNFPPEYISKPKSITPEMIEAEEDEGTKAVLIYLMKF
jgi:hypothetical protein